MLINIKTNMFWRKIEYHNNNITLQFFKVQKERFTIANTMNYITKLY